MTSAIQSFLSIFLIGILPLQILGVPEKQRPREEGLLAKKISVILEKFHYNHPSIDDEFSKRLFKQLFKSLDNEKKFFLKTDYEEFKYLENTLDNLLLKGELPFINRLKDIYVKRVTERLDEVPSLLNQPMDFSKDDFFETDGDKKEFAETIDELQERWLMLLKHQVLSRKIAKDRANEKAEAKKSEQEILDEVRKRLLKSYSRVRRYILKRKAPHLFETFNDLVASACDPHSSHFSASEYENFNISMKLSFEGIGAALVSQDGYTKVVRIIPGGPAERGGLLQPEDIILEVGQGEEEPVNVVDIELDEVVNLIRGTKGTIVKLTIRPGNAASESETKIIPIKRDKVKLEEQSAKATVYEFLDDSEVKKFGYIRVPSFYRDFQAKKKVTMTATGKKERLAGRSSAADVADLIKGFEKDQISGLIMDLRGNGGGSLPDAIEMAGLFFKEGPVVQVRDHLARVKVEKDPDPDIICDAPLLVMVNRFSASASEIFAAAMQDYNRAIVVGNKKTHGKGTVQTVIDLNRFFHSTLNELKPGALKLTISKFYRVSGHSTQLKGVKPDILLPGLYDGIKTGEESLDYSLEWDTIPSANYSKVGPEFTIVDELQEKSDSRTSINKYFQNVRARSELIAKNRNETLVSLNEAKRIEKQEISRLLSLEAAKIRRKWQLDNRLISKEQYEKWEERDNKAVVMDPDDIQKEQTRFSDKIRKMGKEKREAREKRSWRDQEVDEALAILADMVNSQ